ncbi:MAG: hypothetical protein Q8P67_00030 [archaeon]|nr:hypothetical protein [archaeon]
MLRRQASIASAEGLHSSNNRLNVRRRVVRDGEAAAQIISNGRRGSHA